MYNHTAVAKAAVTAVCTLAIQLLTIGIGARFLMGRIGRTIPF